MRYLIDQRVAVVVFPYLSHPLDDLVDTLDHSSAHPMDLPSQVTTNSRKLVTPTPGESHETWFLRRYLQNHLASSQTPDPLFACFCALIELHLSKAPLNIPLLTNSPKSEDMAIVRYGGWFREMPTIWFKLRKELDSHRMQSVQMARYIKQRFNAQQQLLLTDLLARFDIHLRGLDIVEATLRDQIAIQSSGISTEMAQQSIKESKRVALGKP